MKKIIIASFALLTLAASCKKSKDTTVTPQTATSAYGQWKWIATYTDGNLGPTNPMTPTNTGNIEILTVNNNGTWNDVVNTLPVASGTFAIGINGSSDSVNFSGSTDYYMVGHKYYTLFHDTIDFYPAKDIVGAGTKLFVKVQ